MSLSLVDYRDQCWIDRLQFYSNDFCIAIIHDIPSIIEFLFHTKQPYTNHMHNSTNHSKNTAYTNTHRQWQQHQLGCPIRHQSNTLFPVVQTCIRFNNGHIIAYLILSFDLPNHSCSTRRKSTFTFHQRHPPRQSPWKHGYVPQLHTRYSSNIIIWSA
jgi:hypothetical protein